MIEKSSLRNRLLKERLQILPAERKLAEKKISVDLKQILSSQKGPLGFYWPVKGEFDPRQVVKGGRMAFAGLRKEKDRHNVIAYLKEASTE